LIKKVLSISKQKKREWESRKTKKKEKVKEKIKNKRKNRKRRIKWQIKSCLNLAFYIWIMF